MFKKSKVFSSFSTDDIKKAKEFYGQTMGLDVNKTPWGLKLDLTGGTEIFIYPKPNHKPATFTILNFPVTDIDEAVDKLTKAGVKFEHYDGEIQTDKKGIARSSGEANDPSIAWFTDPAGNILSVLELGK